MAGRIPIYRRVGDVLRTRPGKADRGICTSCHRMPSRALPPATAQLDDLCAHPPRLPQLHHARIIDRRGDAFPPACPSCLCAWPVRSAGLLTISSSSSGHGGAHAHRCAAGHRPAPVPGRPLLNPAATGAGQRAGSVTGAVREVHGLSPLTRRLRSLSRSISLP